ncbi:MAG: zf-HC2 domain-containing protein, partial [Hydrogenovibrio crunogenus]|nr:zf-HC2 domain-containing protein [Hydrogenovibrio crunogenus]
MNHSERAAHPDIHAYIDGELTGAERAEFERGLQQ